MCIYTCVCVCVCRYCSHHDQSSLLQELILAVGYFCVMNRDNQVGNLFLCGYTDKTHMHMNMPCLLSHRLNLTHVHTSRAIIIGNDRSHDHVHGSVVMLLLLLSFLLGVSAVREKSNVVTDAL